MFSNYIDYSSKVNNSIYQKALNSTWFPNLLPSHKQPSTWNSPSYGSLVATAKEPETHECLRSTTTMEIHSLPALGKAKGHPPKCYDSQDFPQSVTGLYPSKRNVPGVIPIRIGTGSLSYFDLDLSWHLCYLGVRTMVPIPVGIEIEAGWLGVRTSVIKPSGGLESVKVVQHGSLVDYQILGVNSTRNQT
ncbi:hypothetical protein VNO77_19813 [Canavalia gladiata]|uniref:Uncharacterized protein n=1 Tax=Canavalia gladiata TaxID=3824 RepID=A0AAN9LNA9_CANGL